MQALLLYVVIFILRQSYVDKKRAKTKSSILVFFFFLLAFPSLQHQNIKDNILRVFLKPEGKLSALAFISLPSSRFPNPNREKQKQA